MTREDKSDVQKLADAIAWVEKNHPLPRCEHGNALRDGGDDLLAPSCGCRAYNLDPDFRKRPKTAQYCVRCQKDLNDRQASKAIRVTVDWNTWLVRVGGNELLGLDCAKRIGIKETKK